MNKQKGVQTLSKGREGVKRGKREGVPNSMASFAPASEARKALKRRSSFEKGGLRKGSTSESSLSVRVPVLSEHKIEIPAISSTAGSLFTIT